MPERFRFIERSSSNPELMRQQLGLALIDKLDMNQRAVAFGAGMIIFNQWTIPLGESSQYVIDLTIAISIKYRKHQHWDYAREVTHCDLCSTTRGRMIASS